MAGSPWRAPGLSFTPVPSSETRRAERRLISLAGHEPINEESVRYLNRLSDLLFVVARVLARHEGGKEVIWIHGDQR